MNKKLLKKLSKEFSDYSGYWDRGNQITLSLYRSFSKEDRLEILIQTIRKDNLLELDCSSFNSDKGILTHFITRGLLYDFLLENPKFIKKSKLRGIFATNYMTDRMLKLYPMMILSPSISKGRPRIMTWVFWLADDFDNKVKDFLELIVTKKAANFKTLHRQVINRYPQIFSELTEDIIQNSSWTAKEIASLFRYEKIQNYYSKNHMPDKTKEFLKWIKTELLFEVISGKVTSSFLVTENIELIEKYL